MALLEALDAKSTDGMSVEDGERVGMPDKCAPELHDRSLILKPEVGYQQKLLYAGDQESQDARSLSLLPFITRLESRARRGDDRSGPVRLRHYGSHVCTMVNAVSSAQISTQSQYHDFYHLWSYDDTRT